MNPLKPPLAEQGRKRTVVNIPSERIKALLMAISEWEGWYEEVVTTLAAADPALVEALPPRPSPEAVLRERIYQEVRGKDVERARVQMRLSRFRREQGVYVPRSRGWKDRENETIKELQKDFGLSGSIDNRSTGIVSHAADGSPQRSAAEIAAEMNNESIPEPTVTVIETIITPQPGLVSDPGIKSVDNDE